MNQMKKVFLVGILWLSITTSVFGEEIWGKFSQYNQATKEVTLAEGDSYIAEGEAFEILFPSFQKGDPLWLKVQGKKVLEAKKITLVELEIQLCPIGAMVTLRRRNGSSMEAKLLKKDSENLFLCPVIYGKLQENIKTTIPIDEISFFENQDKMVSLPSVLEKENPSKIKETKKPSEKIIQLDPSSPEKEGTIRTEKSKDLSGFFQSLAEMAPSFLAPLILWAQNNPIPFLGLVAFLLFMVGQQIYITATKKKSKSSNPLAEFEKSRKIQVEQGPTTLVPNHILFQFQKISNGYDLSAVVRFKRSTNPIQENWDILFFLHNQEKPEEFRLSKNDLAVRTPDSGSAENKLSMNLFTPPKELKIFPILVKSKDSDSLRDPFMTASLIVSGVGEGKTYQKIYDMMKQELLAKNFPLHEVSVELQK